MFRLFHKGQLITIRRIHLINILRTIVHSDQWASYGQINDMGHGLEAVDHKLDFVKSITVTQTRQFH